MASNGTLPDFQTEVMSEEGYVAVAIYMLTLGKSIVSLTMYLLLS